MILNCCYLALIQLIRLTQKFDLLVDEIIQLFARDLFNLCK